MPSIPFAVHFAEVKVHSKTGEIKSNQSGKCGGCRKNCKRKTAASQIKGAVVWGIGMALRKNKKQIP